MADKETMAHQVLFGGRNLAENLKFIPADKWEWKPEAKTKSAHEVLVHLLGNFAFLGAQFGGGEFVPPTDIESAKAAILQATETYAVNLRGASAEKMAEKFKMGENEITVSTFAAMAVVDLFHHHGQIAYIQTLWGDEESHFDWSAFELLN